MEWAIINNQIVENIIVADEEFVQEFYPGSIRIDNLESRPSCGWIYQDNEFICTGTTILQEITEEI
jgi:hypothetical protein